MTQAFDANSPDINATRPRMTKMAKLVVGLSCFNLAILCAVSYLIYGVSETWWVGTVLTYAPRSPFLIPAFILLVASLFYQRESVGINLISMLIVLVPIMGLSIPLELWLNSPPKTDGEVTLTVLSCNVQAFEPSFEKVLEEISNINPDIVAMQETSHGDPRLDEYFRDWHVVRRSAIWVGSRYPASIVAEIPVTQFGGRTAGIVVKVETPAGPIVLSNIHQMTVRWGLKELNRFTLIDGNGIEKLDAWEHDRFLEIIDIREAIDAARQDRPLIVCGDFNAPPSSNLFRKNWGDLQSSFDVACFGYGYTSPCKSNRFWPDNCPWARIDHILCSNDFSIRHCEIGKSDGSDHRLIAAKVVLKPSSSKNSKSDATKESNSP